ncbi:MAG: dicarboxylate/amino acid:cation symporter [Rhabdochlamydiaceae bacterium]|nr:dicarboxylate/amino acid:cation symporter [Rhabdochlamydiaceae bacterium]
MFRKMPYILLVMILACFFLNDLIPVSAKSILYALSLTIKSVIVFLLPLLIFILLFKTAVQLARGAHKMIFFILGAVCLSNFISTMLSGGVGILTYHFGLVLALPHESSTLNPAWLFALPKWVANDQAMFAGLFLGIVMARFKPKWTEKMAISLDVWVNGLMKLFLYLIPIFLCGFVLKLCHDQVLASIVSDYAGIFALIAAAQFSYIAFLYLLSNRFRWKGFLLKIQNMLPAAIAGMGSMSSAAAMPLTILGAEKNAPHSELAKATIPATVNIHLIGDCFAIPIFAFAVLKNFGIPEPAFLSYLLFTCYFVLAKFSVAAIPGGGILVMLPILESYLGFNAEMMSLITALYILFDPIITSANVLGNGAFSMLFSSWEQRKKGVI